MDLPEADILIAHFGLRPHPEGGYFRETFRDQPGPDGRARSTAILFLLKAGQASHWHRVDAVEIWHWHAGAPLELSIGDGSGHVASHCLSGSGFAETRAGIPSAPQVVVPQGHWQSARSLGAFSLVGCTVAPGFEFSGFELAPPDWSPPGWEAAR